jgi:PAS domain S-box-containing protein
MDSSDPFRPGSDPRTEPDDLSTVFDALPQPVIAFNGSGAPVRANAAARLALGVDPSGLAPDAYERLFLGFHPRRRDGSPILPSDLLSRRALRGDAVRGEFLTFTNTDGRTLSFETSGFPLRRDDTIVGAVSVWNDLTYRVGFEQGLRDSEKRYRNLVDRSPDGILVHSEGQFVFANPAAARMLLATDPSEIVGRSVLDMVSPASRDLVAARILQTQTTGASPTFEEQLVCMDGTLLDVETTATTIEYHGKPAIQVIIRDHCEQHLAARTLAQHMSGLEALLKVTTNVLGAKDLQNLLQEVVDASRELTGVRLAAVAHGLANGRFRVCALSCDPIVVPDPPGGLPFLDGNGTLLKLVLSGDSIRLTAREVRRRSSRWHLPEGHPPLRGLLCTRLVAQDGRACGFLMVSDRKDSADFTEEDESLLKQLAAITSLALTNIEARTAAENDRLRLEAAVSALPIGLAVADAQGTITRENQILREIRAGTAELPPAPPDWDVQHAHWVGAESPGQDEHWGLERALTSGETVVGQRLRVKRLDGTEALVIHGAAPIRDATGKVVGGVATLHDITDQARAAAELKALNETLEQRVAVRTGQLRELAFQLTHAEQQERHRLAHMLHDHIQQLLVAAKLHVGIVRQNVPAGFLFQSSSQAEELLRQALDASRSLTVELSPPILHESGLAAGLEWLARSMREKHGLDVEVIAAAGALPVTMNTRVFLYESARELLFNVVKHARVQRARVHLATVGSLAEVTVEDEGCGFDPTGSPNRDAHPGGFGLFSIQQRIEFLGGSLSITSRPGDGCRIVMRLPLEGRDRATPTNILVPGAGRSEFVPPAEPAACDWRAGPRIRVLLADDHKIVRQGLIQLLQGEPDIEVVGEAGDGKVAIEAVRLTHPDVVVMDVSMPLMNGIEATRRILAEYPEVRVVGLSMHDEEDLAAVMREAGAVAFVTKGGPSENLVAAIRNCASEEHRTALPHRDDLDKPVPSHP